MPAEFYERLSQYFLSVGSVLRGEAEAASIFPNTSDIGQSRELIYADFLRNHVPTNCDISLGGFLFDVDGNESKQLDIVVTSNSSPHFVLPSSANDSFPKRFACIDGTIAVVAVKSNLTTTELVNALDNLASIPLQSPLTGRILPAYTIADYDEWPLKIVYATDGASLPTLLAKIESYYQDNPDIPTTRQPELIHVAGKYNVRRIVRSGTTTRGGAPIAQGTYYGQPENTDVWALQFVVNEIQKYASAAQHILYKFDDVFGRIPVEQPDPSTFVSIPPPRSAS